MTQAAHVPERHTPMSLKEDPCVRNLNQTAITKAHSTITPPRIHSKKRCAGEPCIAAGMDDDMSLEMIQIAAGTPRPIINDSNQHVSRPRDLLSVLTPEMPVFIPIIHEIEDVRKENRPWMSVRGVRKKVPPFSAAC
jgi:hypothetical protein